MSSRIPVLDRGTLESMHTGSLLARLKKLRQYEESFGLSDRANLEDEPVPAATGYIEFKDTSAWASAYHDLKEILAGREHLPTAAEREARRKSRGR